MASAVEDKSVQCDLDFPPRGKTEHMYSYEQIHQIANYLLEKTRTRPTIGIICGSGLGGLAESIEDRDLFPYHKIPSFPTSTVPGHAGRLVFGKLRGKQVVCMQGRFHPYEGYPLWKCAMPVRVMKLLGVETLIVTNAAGGLNSDYKVGDVMIIRDHLNLPGFSGNNPLLGSNDDRFGPRFPAMSEAYDKDLRLLAQKVAKELDMEKILRQGVYSMQGGPCFETVAECRALKMLGADVTGMSTVHEVITARHSGIRVFGLSLVTNECVSEYDLPKEKFATHAEVLETGRERGKLVQTFISQIVAEM